MYERKRQLNVRLAIVLGLLTFGLFLPVIGFDFVNYDDPEYVVNNPPVNAGLSPKGVAWAFTTGYEGHWHPLTWISHMLDVEVYGMHPGGHHFTSLCLHVANTILLFLILAEMTQAVWRSAIVSALFAWHPLHVEAVAWISSRKDVLSTLFWLLTMGAYFRYAQKPGAGRMVITLLLFELGLMSKAMLVTLPFVLLLLDYWPLGRISNLQFPISNLENGEARKTFLRLALEKVPFLVLTILSSLAAYRAEEHSGLIMASDWLPLHVRAANALVSYIRYIGKTIWPQHLAALYPYPEGWATWQAGGAALLLLIASIGALLVRRQRPWLFVGWFWFLGTFVPVIGVVLTGLQAMADRYSYVPLIGLFIVAAWSVPGLTEDSLLRKRFVTAGFATALAACLALSFLQIQYWQNSITLFGHTTAITENNIRGEYNLAQALASAGRTNDAIEHYEKCFKMKPNPLEAHVNFQAEGHDNLGIILGQHGDMAAAEEQFREAIRVKPEFGMAHHNLGSVLRIRGALDEAIAEYERASKLPPGDPMVIHNLALTLTERGKFEEAVTNYIELLRMTPLDATVHNDLGLALAGEGKLDEAIEHYRQATMLAGRFSRAHLNWGNALTDMGRPGDARAEFATAIALEPELQERMIREGSDFAARGRLAYAASNFKSAMRLGPVDSGVHASLGLVLAKQGRLAEAIEQFKIAVAMAPTDYNTHYQLGLALVMSGQTESGIAEYREALRINPDAVEVLNDLAWTLATSSETSVRNGDEAIRLAQHACELSSRREARFLGTLDAAYAEAGRFEEAIATAQETEKLAETQKQPEIAQAAAKRLELYRAGKAFRQP